MITFYINFYNICKNKEAFKIAPASYIRNDYSTPVRQDPKRGVPDLA